MAVFSLVKVKVVSPPLKLQHGDTPADLQHCATLHYISVLNNNNTNNNRNDYCRACGPKLMPVSGDVSHDPVVGCVLHVLA